MSALLGVAVALALTGVISGGLWLLDRAAWQTPARVPLRPGRQYVLTDPDATRDPFGLTEETVVRLIEVRDGWVRYVYVFGDDEGERHHSRRERTFRRYWRER